MNASSPPSDPPVLVVGAARAVLVLDAAPTPSARDAQAEAALRLACGLPDLTITRRPSGRPRLEPPYPELGVSLSHRGRFLLAACSPSTSVGVDIEPDTASLEPADLAADNFAPEETRLIAGLDPSAARDAFLRMWVAKEAALKVTGRGIYDGLDQPCLADAFAELRNDGSIVDLAASSRLPPLALAVRRLHLADGTTLYCALAVEAET